MSWQVAKNENHNEEALSRMLMQYEKAENLQKTITINTDRVQLLENEAYKFFGFWNIKNATGIYLDIIGDLVGQPRFNFTDEIYRILIFARIAINTSGGTPENIINIFKILTNFTTIEYNELYPAGIQIQGSGPALNEDLMNYIVDTIDNALPAGVSLDLISEFEKGNVFTCAEEDDVISATEGCGDEDDLTVGGMLSEELYTGFVLDILYTLKGGDNTKLMGADDSYLQGGDQ